MFLLWGAVTKTRLVTKSCI